MFTIYTHTDKMENEGKLYGQAAAHGTKKRMMEWMEVLSKANETIWCKVVRDKDGEVVAAYQREIA